jgi:hypothetical protein
VTKVGNLRGRGWRNSCSGGTHLHSYGVCCALRLNVRLQGLWRQASMPSRLRLHEPWGWIVRDYGRRIMRIVCCCRGARRPTRQHRRACRSSGCRLGGRGWRYRDIVSRRGSRGFLDVGLGAGPNRRIPWIHGSGVGFRRCALGEGLLLGGWPIGMRSRQLWLVRVHMLLGSGVMRHRRRIG